MNALTATTRTVFNVATGMVNPTTSDATITTVLVGRNRGVGRTINFNDVGGTGVGNRHVLFAPFAFAHLSALMFVLRRPPFHAWFD